MQHNRHRDTQAELAVRREVHRRGLRYRVDFAPLPMIRRRRADLVFTRARVAVFIDGCFWHGCPEHHQPPQTNSDYWAEKIHTNRARDLEVDKMLRDEGWLALRFWEHEDPQHVADRITVAVQTRTACG